MGVRRRYSELSRDGFSRCRRGEIERDLFRSSYFSSLHRRTYTPTVKQNGRRVSVGEEVDEIEEARKAREKAFRYFERNE